MKDMLLNVFAAIGIVAVVIFAINYANEKKINENMEKIYDARGIVATHSTDLFGNEAWCTIYDVNNDGTEDNSHNLICAIKNERICRKCGKYIEGAYVMYESIYSADGKLIDGGYECDECYHK